jgi:hypothetical protein
VNYPFMRTGPALTHRANAPDGGVGALETLRARSKYVCKHFNAAKRRENQALSYALTHEGRQWQDYSQPRSLSTPR